MYNLYTMLLALLLLLSQKTGQNYKKYDVQSNIFTIISRNACFLKSLDVVGFKGKNNFMVEGIDVVESTICSVNGLLLHIEEVSEQNM